MTKQPHNTQLYTKDGDVSPDTQRFALDCDAIERVESKWGPSASSNI